MWFRSSWNKAKYCSGFCICIRQLLANCERGHFNSLAFPQLLRGFHYNILIFFHSPRLEVQFTITQSICVPLWPPGDSVLCVSWILMLFVNLDSEPFTLWSKSLGYTIKMPGTDTYFWGNYNWITFNPTKYHLTK